ncbi:MAG: 4Fe-4S dicluster domain-containing protein [Nitrospirae bacterium]|nr:4Fe-4S dicluster domain-containing protein [Nitrospirota bacterium]
MIKNTRKHPAAIDLDRRTFLKGAALGAAAMALPPADADAGFLESFFQKHFREMSDEEIKKVIDRLEKDYSKQFSKEVKVKATKPMENVVFGYGLDIGRCIGCRKCVQACVEENNQSRDPQIQWISVLKMKKGAKMADFQTADKYYQPEQVPEPGYFYLPVQCQQCEDPPCVKVCPTKATWKEKDGIVVIDYNWCIGCRYCMAACPYGARRFNWGTPNVPAEQLNPNTHYLGNRPRPKGSVEKCTFCIQRTREGRYPACVEACPVGARKFGNLADPNSEIRKAMEHFRVFRLKEDLNTKPQFFYFFGVKSNRAEGGK